MEDKTIIVIVAILSLAFMEGCALFNNIDGSYFMPVVSAISAIAGGLFGAEYQKKKSTDA